MLLQLERVKNLRQLASPGIYYEEVHMIDCHEVDGGQNPMYFAIIREPFERFKSKFQYSRKRYLLNDVRNNYRYLLLESRLLVLFSVNLSTNSFPILSLYQFETKVLMFGRKKAWRIA